MATKEITNGTIVSKATVVSKAIYNSVIQCHCCNSVMKYVADTHGRVNKVYFWPVKIVQLADGPARRTCCSMVRVGRQTTNHSPE